MNTFNRRQPVNSIVEIPKYKGTPYLHGGLRRVYSSGSWSEQWRNWSKRNGSIDCNGSYLTNVRPYHNGKQREYYVDMSMAHIDIQYLNDIQPFDPVNTKYMTKHYVNGKSLKELAHMSTNDFLRFIEGIGKRRTNPNRTGKRR